MMRGVRCNSVYVGVCLYVGVFHGGGKISPDI